MNKVDALFNGFGILGSLLLLVGFYRASTGRWTSKSFWYEFDNVLGALLIIVYQVRYHAYVSVVVNLIWGTVAFWGVLMFIRRWGAHRRRSRSHPTKHPRKT